MTYIPSHSSIEKNSEKQQAESLERHNMMLKTPIPVLVTKLAIPTVISQLITVIYNTADTFFVARIHTSAAAAVGVVFALMSIIQAFGFGISMGANSLISRRLGEKRDEEAHICASSAVFMAFLFGIFLLIGGEFSLKSLLRMMGATDTILVYALDYTKYILMGAPLMCASFVMHGILRAEGETQFAMWGICTGGILNCILDPLFINTFGLGISGAAIATVLSQGISFLILISFFLRGRSIVYLQCKWVSANPYLYWLIFFSGLPTVCRQGLGSLSSAVLNVLAAGYGDAAVAAITIANKIYMLVRNLVIGVGQGMQPVTGYNFGAGNIPRVRKAFVFTCVLGSSVCILATVLIAPFASQVIALFRPDEDVVQIGRTALLFGCAVMPVMAYSTYVNQLGQCLGFQFGATVLASCRQGIFFFPAAWLLLHFAGLTGLAAVQPVADLCTFLVSLPYQVYFFRTHLRCPDVSEAVAVN